MSTVKFCSQCDSLYFIQHKTHDNKLNYVCKNCGNQEECEKHLIHEQDYKKNHKLSYIEEILKLNPELINDPSIPKVTNLNCKNDNCKNENKKVAIIKYDDQNLSYIYICYHCKYYWTNTN